MLSRDTNRAMHSHVDVEKRGHFGFSKVVLDLSFEKGKISSYWSVERGHFGPARVDLGWVTHDFHKQRCTAYLEARTLVKQTPASLLFGLP